MSQNFRLFLVSNLSVRNFRIFLLMYTGPNVSNRLRVHGRVFAARACAAPSTSTAGVRRVGVDAAVVSGA